MKKFLIFSFIVVSCLLLVVGFAQADVTATDPLRIGVGARSLGMGRAFVAVAEDADTIFSNPAGLGELYSPKITSMYTTLMSDVNYIVLGGAYPFGKNSGIGAGIITSNVGGISLYDGTGTSLGSASWNNSLIFASYGLKLQDERLKVGGTLKYYTQGGSGNATVEAAAGSAIGLDAGVLYSVSDALSLGVVAQNPLGTKLESGNSVSNALPTVIKTGVAYRLPIGAEGKLTLAADYDLISKRSNAFHAGAEYFITPMFALRAGLDQDPAPEGTVTNLTAGLGLRVNGIAFDFAYHPYGNLAEDTTYYFSLGFVGAPEPKKLDLEMVLNSPVDKSKVYTDSVKVAGTLKGKLDGINVKVNGVNATLSSKGAFVASVPIDKLGKKLIHVEAVDNKGRKITADRRVLRLVSFKDVTGGYWAKNPIENTGTVGLIQGYPDGSFRPDRSLSRSELAAILVRAKEYKLPGRPVKVFKDVPANHWAAGYVEIAKRTGLIKGYPDGRFRPNNRISNSEAVTVMARFDGMSKKFGKTAFSDVSKKHWSAGYVNAAQEAGMLSYVSGTEFNPDKSVTRAQSVQMLAKTSMATKLVDQLLSWDKGFQFEITRPTIKASLY
ncbi:MAG: PorV/PorQ family protein [Candidatus Saganbacteria bacterium]|nr:PorV/PorQ family protein [Candidatus Saganbacteria bacterium]